MSKPPPSSITHNAANPQAVPPQQFLSIAQQQLNTMLQTICSTIQQRNARPEEKKIVFNKRMSHFVAQYLDHLDRFENETNKLRSILRRDYAIYKQEQAHKLQEEKEALSRSFPVKCSTPIPEPEGTSAPDPKSNSKIESEPESKPETNTQSNPDNELSQSAIEDSNSASIDIDSMFNDLVPPSPHEQSDLIDIDLGTFGESVVDVSNLLPDPEPFTNIATTSSTNTPAATTTAPQTTSAPAGPTIDSNDLLADTSMDINDSALDDLFNFDRVDFEANGDKEGGSKDQDGDELDLFNF